MELEKELKKLLEEWKNEVGKIDKSLLPLVDQFIKANKGGKGIRGKLVVLGFQLAAHLPGDKAHLEGEINKIAAAYEIFHTAILAHDDIIDKDPVRRGQPSLYQALGGDHQGVSLALTLADAGFFLATKIIAESKFPTEEKTEALKYFSKIMLETAMGQLLDIEKGDSLLVAKYKTAKYTVSGPLCLGAILGGVQFHLRGAKAHLGGVLDKLDKFGVALGIAFQIQDDILDGEAGKDHLQQLIIYRNKALKIIPQITKEPKMSKILLHLVEDLVERTR